ncbi:MAG: oligosaccharide flippase family protein [Rhodobacteraceae bacterium]|nr:oligosaccharide flippase family protein [Paracoccaceae bacterium]
MSAFRAGSTAGPGRAARAAPAGEALAHLSGDLRGAAVRGTLWSGVNVAVATTVSAAVFLLAARLLAVEDFGTVALALAIVAALGCLVPVAFGDALVQRAAIAPRHLDTVFWACILASAALYAVLAAGAGPVARWTGHPDLASILPVLGLRLPLDAAAAVPLALIQRRMRFRQIALRTTAANLAGGAACVVLALAGGGLWSLVAMHLVTAAAGAVVLWLSAGWSPGFDVTAGAWRDLRRFGLAAGGLRALDELRLDQLILGALAGPAMLGLYYFARRLSQIATDLTVGVVNPVASVLLATVQADRERRRRAFAMGGFAAAAASFPVAAGLLALADPAIPLLFGAQWAEAVPAVRALAVLLALAGVGVIQAALIKGCGEAGWWFRYQLLQQGLNAALVALLHDHGLAVMMWALAAKTALLWPLSVRKTLHLLGAGPAPYRDSLLAPAAAAAAMLAVLLLMPLLLPPLAAWALLGLQVAAGAAVYAAALALAAPASLRVLLGALSQRRAGLA